MIIRIVAISSVLPARSQFWIYAEKLLDKRNFRQVKVINGGVRSQYNDPPREEKPFTASFTSSSGMLP